MQLLYKQTEDILYQIECYLLNDKPYSKRIFIFLQKNIFFPMLIFLKGIKIICISIKRCIILTIFTILIMLLSNFISKNSVEISSSVFIFYCFIFALLLVVFCTPSTIKSNIITEENIKVVIESINNLKLTSIEQIQLFRTEIGFFQKAIKKRIFLLNTVLGFGWAFYLFIWGKILETGKTTISMTPALLLITISLIILFFLIQCYSLGTDYIFNTIELSINEMEFSLLKNKQNLINNTSFKKIKHHRTFSYKFHIKNRKYLFYND